MDPPHIDLFDAHSLLVVNTSGKMRQLFVPIRAQVVMETQLFPQNTWVIVEEVQMHRQYRLIYKVGHNWWPYYVFKLSVVF